MNYATALRGYTAKRVEEIETADILVGIPCYNNESTIVHVIRMVTRITPELHQFPRIHIF